MATHIWLHARKTKDVEPGGFFQRKLLGAYNGFQLRSQVENGKEVFYGGQPGGRTYGPCATLKQVIQQIDGSKTKDSLSPEDQKMKQAFDAWERKIKVKFPKARIVDGPEDIVFAMLKGRTVAAYDYGEMKEMGVYNG